MKIATEPLVSVLMTAYNREKYIAEAIESILESSYTNFELIIVDDCSKDTTVEIAKKYAFIDNRVKVYVNEKNLGDYPNRNKAASYAKGQFIMYVDSDDRILKDGIEKCVNAMISFPNSNFGIYSLNEKSEPYELDSADALQRHFFKTPFLIIGPGGTIIRRNFFEEIKGYPEKYGPANDMYFNLKVCSYTNIIMLPFEFIYYRRHEGQEINNSYNYLINNYIYLRDSLEQLPLQLEKAELEWIEKKNKRRFFVNIVKYFLQTKSIARTREVLKKTNFGLGDAFEGVFH